MAPMPLFRLHLYTSTGFVPDDEGHDLADAEAAHRQAIRSIRDLLSEEVKNGRIDFNGRVVIVDARGDTVGVISFSEAVREVPAR
ncbi:MAG TPA: hypothetical protein VNH53_07975 [Sphingomicrobium sp.]|jgi:hypothetical protein|nr:hypothetical protein [Sphingomicrobium sp.]